MEVHRKLGEGFLGKVYENAMMVLFKREKTQAIQQAPIDVIFENEFDRLFWWQTPIAVLKPKF